MTVTLVTIEGVELVSTGTYQCASGEEVFSAEDLADAVRAAQDPTIVAPRLKLGHNDPRFNEAVQAGQLDGEPAFGTAQNLRLSADGQTVIGDYVDVPEWLADTLQSSYPGRSIEGGRNYTAASGNQYSLVIDAVALLGVTWPGVGSLADLREILEQNGSAEAGEALAASSERLVMARVARPAERQPASVTAGMDLGSIRQMFCGDLDDGEVPSVPDGQPGADDVGHQIWWWPRSIRVEDDGTLNLIVDDDEGHLLQIPFTVQQADLVYGEPMLVMESYVPVTADPDDGVTASGRRPRVLASWPVRAAGRPSATTEVPTMDVDIAVLRTRLGLAEDADEAAVNAALAAESAPETEPVTASTPNVPEGMVLVDAETLATVRQGAEAGVQAATQLATEARDRAIQAAIDEGRFPVSRRGHYETMWERDPDGARTLCIASVEEGGLAPGLVPTGGRELGGSGEGDEQGGSQAEHAAFMQQHFPQNTARLAARANGRVRVRQEA